MKTCSKCGAAKAKKTIPEHRPNGLIAEMRSHAPAPDKVFIAKANKEARAALASAKAAGPGQLSSISVRKIQKLLAHR